MKLAAALGLMIGAALAAWLLASYGFGRILNLLSHVGWLGLAAVIGFHAIQVVFSAAGWRAVAGATVPRPGLREFALLRLIREGVNNLLPVGQVGGDFVATRLLQRRGVKPTAAIAGMVCDVTMELVTQIAFTLMGLGLLVLTVGGSDIVRYAIGGVGVAVTLAAAFLAVQWFGPVRMIETALMRLGRAIGWHGAGKVEGLQDALLALYRAPRQLAWSAAWHFACWMLGGVEVCLALHFLGTDAPLATGLVIESLGQASKAAGFVVPGALGVQEGGYIVVCGLFGLPPDVAIALSLVKRLREIALGLPGIAAWRWLEREPSPALSHSSGAVR